MTMPTGRFSQLRWLQNVACVVAMVGGLVLCILALAGVTSSAVWMCAAGAFVFYLAMMVLTIVPLILKVESTVYRQLSELHDLQRALTDQTEKLDAIVVNTRISDSAKSLARRDEELDALRQTIRNDIQAERWEAALNLIEEMDQRFGYREEAERVREEVDRAREDRIQAKLTEAIELVNGHFAAHDWVRAQAEIDRLLNALPDDSRVQSLQDRMRVLQEQHKQELRLAWDDAVRRTDTDLAIDVLKELDQYLSSSEAQTLQETARTVFKEKLLQLGVQFRFAVGERRWNDALAVGLEIIRDYPNARMAAEVRDALDMLRQRAHQTQEGEPAHASE